jgi:hypothetical protein
MKTTEIQKTKIVPLRWIGNFCGEYAGNHLVKAIDLDESLDSQLGLRFKYHAKMWKYLNKPYEWWGTYYMVDLLSFKEDMSGPEWDDYDEDGIAYWEK